MRMEEVVVGRKGTGETAKTVRGFRSKLIRTSAGPGGGESDSCTMGLVGRPLTFGPSIQGAA